MKTCLRFVVSSALLLTLLLASPTPTSSNPAVTASFSTQQTGLGPEYQLSASSIPETDRYAPAAAYNTATRQTLVVWHRHGGGNYYIEGRLLDANGKPLGTIPTILVSGATPVYNAAVAYDATLNRYMLVWMRNTLLDGKTYAIWGKILSANLSEVRAEFQIIAPVADHSLWTPRVAWNSNVDEFMVVWNAYNISAFPQMFSVALAQATLYENGDIVPNPVTVIYNTPENMIYPSGVDLVFFDNGSSYGKYMWVWKQVKPGTADFDIWAANIDAHLGGYLPGLPPWKIDDSTVQQSNPRIATTGANDFMVVWQQCFGVSPCDWDVRAREMNQLGVFVGLTHVIAGTSVDETAPFIAAWPGTAPRYVVGFESKSATGQGVWLGYYNNGANTVSIVDLGLTFWLDTFPVADFGFWNNSAPAGVVAAPRVQIAYRGASNTPGDHTQIYSRAWTPYLTSLPLIRR